MSHFQDLPGNLWLALAVNLAIAFASYKAKLVDRTGLWSGLFVGILVFIGMGYEGFIILFAFFFAGSLASKFKMNTKEKMGVAQKKGGQRGLKHVFANCSVATACAVLAVFTDPLERGVWFVAFAAALATALGDTISTELGQIYGRKTYLLITLERVKAGTEGAISLEGTFLGFGASFLIAMLALVFHPFAGYGLRGVLVVSLAAMMANFIESIIGGIYHQFNVESPETVLNFGNTLVGALLAALWFS